MHERERLISRHHFKKVNMKKNRVRCKKCNEILESEDVDDFQWCRCGAISIDGKKRTGLPENIEELLEEDKNG